MYHGWLWLWLIFLFFLFLVPTGYGWGYRGWGPPYPGYFRRRAAVGPSAPVGAPDVPHHGWGLGAELLWLVLLFAVIWLVIGLFWW